MINVLAKRNLENLNQVLLNSPHNANHDVVDICYCADNGAIWQLMLSLNSILETKNLDTLYSIHILLNNVDVKYKDMLQFFNIKNSMILDLIDIDMSDIQTLNVTNTGSSTLTNTAFARFLIPKYIPTTGRILYLDVDTLIRKDLTEFFQQDMGEDFLVACSEFALSMFLKDKVHDSFFDNYQYIRKFGLNRGYFSSGVILFDFGNYSGSDFTNECVKCFIDHRSEFKCDDQDVLNYLYADRTKFCEPRYNMQFVLLFRTDTKPFTYSDLNCIYGTKYASRESAMDDSVILHAAFDKNLAMTFDVIRNMYVFESNKLLLKLDRDLTHGF